MTERLDHHGDVEVRGATHLVDLAVNVRVGTPPAWLAEVIRDTTGQLAAYPDPSVARAAVAHRHGVPEDMVLPTSGGAEAFTLIAGKLNAIRAQGLLNESGYPRVAATFGGGGTPQSYMGTLPAFLSAWGPVDMGFGSGQGVKCYHSEHLYGEFWHRAFIVAPDTPPEASTLAPHDRR